MNVLIDTNVISETRRPTPSLTVVDWLDRLDEGCAFLSVVTIAEIRFGYARLQPGRQRDAIADWANEELPLRFAGRILPVDERVALAWGDLMAEARRNGNALSIMDGFLAATARVHDFTLATRNIRDFEPLGIRLIDPWTSGRS